MYLIEDLLKGYPNELKMVKIELNKMVIHKP